jgi:uncharacterized membrane protein YvbJ
MPYCHNCGSEVKEEDSFCPQCGATLKVGAPTPPIIHEHYRREKSEKAEKQEKREKDEKMEKGEQTEKYETKGPTILGPLVGGIILIFVGLVLYLTITDVLDFHDIFPFFLIVIGVVVILGVAIGAFMAKEKNPRP